MRVIPIIFIVLISASTILIVDSSETTTTSAKDDDAERDGETSRKIIGSSVVTSVSVILNGQEPPKFSDAVGKPIPRPLVPPQVASPINLLNPDRYEFYTFNDHGDLVKRLMTMKEIQSIVAGGASDSTILHNNHQVIEEKPSVNVHDIVNNVQQLLIKEVEAKKNSTAVTNILDTPDVSSSWSLILPAVFGNTGADIHQHKAPQQVVMTPDSVVLDTTSKRPITHKPITNNYSGNKIDNKGEKIPDRKPVTSPPNSIFVTRRKLTTSTKKPTTQTTSLLNLISTMPSRFATRRKPTVAPQLDVTSPKERLTTTFFIETTTESVKKSSTEYPKTPGPLTTKVTTTTTPIPLPEIIEKDSISQAPISSSVLTTIIASSKPESTTEEIIRTTTLTEQYASKSSTTSEKSTTQQQIRSTEESKINEEEKPQTEKIPDSVEIIKSSTDEIPVKIMIANEEKLSVKDEEHSTSSNILDKNEDINLNPSESSIVKSPKEPINSGNQDPIELVDKDNKNNSKTTEITNIENTTEIEKFISTTMESQNKPELASDETTQQATIIPESVEITTELTTQSADSELSTNTDLGTIDLFDTHFSLNQIIESLKGDPSTEHMGLLLVNDENMEQFIKTTTEALNDDANVTDQTDVSIEQNTTAKTLDEEDAPTEINEEMSEVKITTDNSNSNNKIESETNLEANSSNVYKNELMFVDEEEPLVYDIPTTTDFSTFTDETPENTEPIALKLEKPKHNLTYTDNHPVVQKIENFIDQNPEDIPDSLAIETNNREEQIAKVAALGNIKMSEYIEHAATLASLLSRDDELPLPDSNEETSDLSMKEITTTAATIPNSDKFHQMEVFNMLKDQKTNPDKSVSYETLVVKKTSSVSVGSSPNSAVKMENTKEKVLHKSNKVNTDPTESNMIRVQLLTNDKEDSTEVSIESDVHEEIKSVKVKMPKTTTTEAPKSEITTNVESLSDGILDAIGMIDEDIMKTFNLTNYDDEDEGEDENVEEEIASNESTENTSAEKITDVPDRGITDAVEGSIDVISEATEISSQKNVINENSLNNSGGSEQDIEKITESSHLPTTLAEHITKTTNLPFESDELSTYSQMDEFSTTEKKSEIEQTTTQNVDQTTIMDISTNETEEEKQSMPESDSNNKNNTTNDKENSDPKTSTSDTTTKRTEEITETFISDYAEVPTTADPLESKFSDDFILSTTKPLDNNVINGTEKFNLDESKNSIEKEKIIEFKDSIKETDLSVKNENVFVKLGETTTSAVINDKPTSNQISKKHAVLKVNDRANVVISAPKKTNQQLNYRPYGTDQKIYHINTPKPSVKMPPFNSLKMKVGVQGRRPPVQLEPAPKQALGLEESTMNANEDIIEFAKLCNELAFTFWRSLTSEGISSARSIVVSPFALTSMLAMIFLGARGSTSGEMNEMLRLDDMVTFNPHLIFRNITDSVENAKESDIATSAFIRELFSDRTKGKLLAFYKDKAQQFYSGHVEEVNFNIINDIVRRRTNLLVKRHTSGKINEYLKTNSIWLNPPLAGLSANIFQTDCSAATSNERDGEMFFQVLPAIRQRRLVPVPAAVWKSGFTAGYDPELDATVVAFGGTSNAVSTIFVMPGQQGHSVPGDNIERLESDLMSTAITKNTWKRLLTTLMDRPGLEVQLPRFSHRSFINATNGLLKMGLNHLFDFEKADLGGLTGSATNDLFISNMVQINTFSTCGEGKIHNQHHMEIYPAPPLQQRNVKYENSDNSEEQNPVLDYQDDVAFHDPLLDEKYLDLPLPLRPRQARLPESPRLRFDKPFLYFVRHNPTGMILYMGRFNPRLLP